VWLRSSCLAYWPVLALCSTPMDIK
jgi:hypothetical protein